MYIKDNYDLFEAHEARQEAKLLKLPLCAYCDERIQDDCFYLINDECICPDCLDTNFKKNIEDYIE